MTTTIITPYEPKISEYMVPSSVTKIDFYDQWSLDLPQSDHPRELQIIELVGDPDATRFVTFGKAKIRGAHFSETAHKPLIERLKEEGQFEGWLERVKTAGHVPYGIQPVERTLYSLDAYEYRADWWEVVL